MKFASIVVLALINNVSAIQLGMSEDQTMHAIVDDKPHDDAAKKAIHDKQVAD